jgi:hypothetical protein
LPKQKYSTQLYMKIRQEQIPGRSGTLSQRTKKKQLKDGSTREYPLVKGQRHIENINDWFWHYTFKFKQADGKFKTRTISVLPAQVPIVKSLIVQNVDVETISSYLRGSK